MPIRINLLAEQKLNEEMRRRDPVKHGFWVAGFLVALMLLWSLYLKMNNWSAGSELKRLNTNTKELESKFNLVRTNKALIKAIDAKLDALFQLSTNRFLWGSALNTLPFAVVDNIELTTISAQQDFTLVPEKMETKKIAATSTTAASEKKVRIPASATEKLVVTIEGRCYGGSASERIEQFRRNLKNSEYFKLWLTNDALATITAQSLLQTDPADTTRTFVSFTLKCDFPERKRE